jgi:hypothetical protein
MLPNSTFEEQVIHEGYDSQHEDDSDDEPSRPMPHIIPLMLLIIAIYFPSSALPCRFF